MTFDEYDANVQRTFAQRGSPFWDQLMVSALGLTGESGEVADMIKKVAYHGQILTRGLILQELGDVLYYVSTTARALGSSLGEVAEINSLKLHERYPDGFSVERGVHIQE